MCGIDLAGVKISKEIDISDLEGWRQVISSDKLFGKIAICDGLLMLWLFWKMMESRLSLMSGVWDWLHLVSHDKMTSSKGWLAYK